MLIKRIKVFNNIKLDFLHLEEKSDNNANIFSTSKYVPQLNNNSKFLVTFDDGTMISHGVSSEAVGYTFSIYRETKDSSNLSFVAKLNEGELSLFDYNILGNTSYKYYIFKESDSSISEAIATNQITTCWDDWSLVDVISDNKNENLYYANSKRLWRFNLNLQSADTTQTMNTTVYNNLTQFPKISMGKLNYASGSITCLLGSLRKDGDNQYGYYEPISLLKEWNEFCTNGNLKLLKDRKGNSMLVAITGTSSNVDDISPDQINTITFNWTQVDQYDNIMVIGG